MTFLQQLTTFNDSTVVLPGDPPAANSNPIFSILQLAVNKVEQQVNRALNLPVTTSSVTYQSQGITSQGWIVIGVIALLLAALFFGK